MRVLLADDHTLVRQGLVPFVQMLDANTVVVEASDLDEALRAARDPQSEGFDLVLLDLKMPGMRGAQGLQDMCQTLPSTPVVILSGSVEAGDVMAAADNGAAGYLPKTLNSTAMINALRLVLSGERYFPSFAFAAPRPEATDGYAQDNPLSRLEERERTILGMVVDGRTNKEIARALDLQEVTIKVQTRNIYRKLGAANRSQAVRIAMENGWRSQTTV